MSRSSPTPAPAGAGADPTAGTVRGGRVRRILRGRFFSRWALTPLVALAGAVVGILLVPPTTTEVGPLTASVLLRPSLQAETAILLPPVGEVAFDTHRAPVRIEVRVRGVDIGRAQELIADPSGLQGLETEAPDALTRAAGVSAALNALFAALGAGAGVALTYRRTRRSLIAAGSAVAVVGAASGLVAATFRPQSLQQPRFDGLLSQAAYVADLGELTAANYADYRRTIAEFVGQVSALYVAADALPTGGGTQDLTTILHVSDIHDNPQAFDVIEQLEDQFDIDAVIDTGDIISWGMAVERRQLAVISDIDVPYVFIQGNHDGSGASRAVAANPNAIVLDNEVAEVAGLRIAGIGDPRFAADDDSQTTGWGAGKDAVANSAFQLGDTVQDWDAEHPEDPVDLALIHDPTQPDGLLGRTPLVLSGHMHTSKVELDAQGSGTAWLTVGSTGGALGSGGVRPVLDGGRPLDLTARMLYFDPDTHRLIAYDDIVMGGLGLVSISIERHQLPADPPEQKIPEGDETPSDPVPSDQVVEPGKGLDDEDRVTPSDSSHRLPSDGGGASSRAPTSPSVPASESAGDSG